MSASLRREPYPPYPLPPFVLQRRWDHEYVTMLHAANDAGSEQVRLLQHVQVLEQELQAARFAVMRVEDLGNADRARIGAALRARLDAITKERRRRHWPDGESP